MKASAELKFLLDNTLQRLGRWLRTAGYDTEFMDPPSRSKAGNDHRDGDYYQLRRAVDEGRYLLTTNHSLYDLRQARGTVICLHHIDLEGCVQELSSYLNIDWHFRPLSRCIGCNSALQTHHRHSTEEQAYCHQCKQVSWSEQAERIQRQLQNWTHKYTH